MKVLNIVESAYRGTLEEQDDTVLWLSNTLRGAGADLAVLLIGNAVSYGVRDQDASGLSFGALRQTQPPRLAEAVSKLARSGAEVHVVREDLEERGIETRDLVPGLELLPRRDVAALLDRVDLVWHW